MSPAAGLASAAPAWQSSLTFAPVRRAALIEAVQLEATNCAPLSSVCSPQGSAALYRRSGFLASKPDGEDVRRCPVVGARLQCGRVLRV